jgi:phosphate transport system substrate-binding protein
MKIILLLIISAFLLIFPAAGWADLHYSGSSTIAIVLQESGAVAAFEKKMGIKLDPIDIVGSGKGLDALIAGKANIAGVSRALNTKERNEKLSANTIGYDTIGIFVHKSNPLKGLTKQQLKDIFTGKISNWKELGGNNAPIVPIIGDAAQKRGSTDFFREIVLEGIPFGSFENRKFPRDQAEELTKREYGISYISVCLLETLGSSTRNSIRSVTVNQVAATESNVRNGSYPLSRPLLLVTKGVPKGAARDFINFMQSNEGQSLVDVHFVPLRKPK